MTTLMSPETEQDPSDTILPKVWITKYALTQGVFTAVNVTHYPDRSGRMIGVPQTGGLPKAYFHAPDWHTTEASARAQVQKMIVAERAALTKKLAKLAKLDADTLTGLPTAPWGQG